MIEEFAVTPEQFAGEISRIRNEDELRRLLGKPPAWKPRCPLQLLKAAPSELPNQIVKKGK